MIYQAVSNIICVGAHARAREHEEKEGAKYRIFLQTENAYSRRYLIAPIRISLMFLFGTSAREGKRRDERGEERKPRATSNNPARLLLVSLVCRNVYK